MFGRRANLVLGCLAGAVAFGSFGVAAQARTRARKPHISAHPDNAMVRGHMTLKGSRFPANRVIELRECGRTFWLAPEEPRNTADAVFVKTDRSGRFVTSFFVEVCPEGEPGRVITERTCYIGEPQVTEDTFTLAGAVKITVTYP